MVGGQASEDTQRSTGKRVTEKVIRIDLSGASAMLGTVAGVLHNDRSRRIGDGEEESVFGVCRHGGKDVRSASMNRRDGRIDEMRRQAAMAKESEASKNAACC